MEFIKDIVSYVEVKKSIVESGNLNIMNKARERGIDSLLSQFIDFYSSYEGDKSKLSKHVDFKDTKSEREDYIGFTIGLRIYKKD